MLCTANELSDAKEKLESSRVILSNGCWTSTQKPNGLGFIYFKYKNSKGVSTRIISYEVYIGPIPKHHWVKQTCKNHACHNPAHLILVSNKLEKMI